MNKLQLTSSSFAAKLAVILLFTLQSVSLSADEHAHHHHQSDNALQVEGAFATPTFALAKMGAGYFTLINTGDKDVAISELQVDKAVARTIEMHETWFDGDMAKMRRLTMPFTIKAGATVEFVPQGKHLMIIGLEKPLEKGDDFDVTLTFASGETQVISIPVLENQNQQENGQEQGHHHHH